MQSLHDLVQGGKAWPNFILTDADTLTSTLASTLLNNFHAGMLDLLPNSFAEVDPEFFFPRHESSQIDQD